MKKVLTFLKKLEKNNNRDWFQANKPEYEAAREDFIGLVEKLIAGISKFDPEIIGTDPKKAVFRIYRDVRFSKDKSPYKLAFGASISPGATKMEGAGYYVHIQPKGSMLAGGKYMPQSKELLAIRNAVVKRSKDFLKIPKAKKFKEYFGEIRGDKLKTAPKGFPKDHEMIEYLRLKSFVAYHEKIPQKTVTDPKFDKYAVRVFKAMKPLNDFLREAIGK
ncbi:MAG: DUF2461 domain-containing protein [Pyrinomonadaceae bacterium]|nr:DUF2461 domain-containing protein [Pyrinomonadaceae bacterium]